MSHSRHIFSNIVANGVIPFAQMFSLVAAAGCKMLGWNAQGYANAWDDLRCDRRTAVFVNLRLDTAINGEAPSSSLQKESQSIHCSTPTSTSPSSYNRALAYLYSRNVSEVVFSGRTTAHGTIAEFRALNAGFSSIPDAILPKGSAK